MTLQRRNTFSTLAIFTAAFMASAAFGAPLKSGSSLPLTGDDLVQARASITDDAALQQFATFIKGIDVYPDHTNPKAIPDVENRSKAKIFWISPFFQASEERPVVGGQEIAQEGIKIIAQTYDLITTFDFELLKITQLNEEKKNKNSALTKLRTNLPLLTDQLAINSTNEMIKQIEKEIVSINAQVAALESRAEQGLGETSIGLRKQVVGQIQLKLSFLGVVPTAAEQVQLNGTKAQDLRLGISSMIARATSQGQYGFRNATYDAGYSKQQKDWIGLYRRIRPDVQVSALSTNKVYAKSTALTSKTTLVSSFPYFLGSSQIVNAPRLFLAVNGGSNGACGNTQSCNVTLEYTWLGATMAQSAKSGVVTMPVYFEADVSFMQPDFEGSVDCDFKNGFKVQGRADVKDGAVIYDGDVYNKINYSAIEDGACNYEIVKGDADSAAYYTIKTIYEKYMNLKMERAAKSRDEMDRYRAYVNKELQYHQAKAQNTSFDFWSLGTWTSAFGGFWGTVTSFVIGGARSFYWHTRIEDSTVTEAVKFKTKIKETNVQKTERVAFDGFTMLCWKVDGSDRALAACPSAKLADYQNQADTDLGKNQQACGENGTSGSCVDTNTDTTPETDDGGVIQDPWG